MLSVRPKIAELVFQLYGRPLHPELFEIYASRKIERGGYTATVQITSAGHLVTWNYGKMTLTEVATSAHHPLPTFRRLMSHQLKGECVDGVKCHGGIRYDTQFSLEPVDRDAFALYQKELAFSGKRRGMLHHFNSSGRFGPDALSYINIESRDRSFKVQAFHTFPDDFAIVKSQSVFTLPK